MAGDDRTLWARILKADEASHLLVLEREDWPGAAVFTNPAEGERNLAVLGQAAPGAADGLLEALAGHYRAAGVTPRLRVTPLSLPEDWPARLARRGFTPVESEDELFMIRQGPWDLPTAAGVVVCGVPAEASVEEFARVQHVGWGGDGAGVGRALELSRRGVAMGQFRHFLAFVDGQAAGAATAHLQEGLAGIYGLATLPEYRRRGVATAIVAHVANLAWREGCHTVFLSAEPDGEAGLLYQRLGFQPAFTVRNYALRSEEVRDAAEPGR